jgi:hypothetical protein
MHPDARFVPQAGHLICFRQGTGDDEHHIAKMDFSETWETEAKTREFCAKYNLPIAEGEKAERILKLYQEQQDAEVSNEDAEEAIVG